MCYYVDMWTVGGMDGRMDRRSSCGESLNRVVARVANRDSH